MSTSSQRGTVIARVRKKITYKRVACVAGRKQRLPLQRQRLRDRVSTLRLQPDPAHMDLEELALIETEPSTRTSEIRRVDTAENHSLNPNSKSLFCPK